MVLRADVHKRRICRTAQLLGQAGLAVTDREHHQRAKRGKLAPLCYALGVQRRAVVNMPAQ